MSIPRIIHQTWRTSAIPPRWQPLADEWRRLHPAWTYRLWTNADNERLVRRHYPDLLVQYESCSYDIQRADIARCLVLHRYGGVYVDLDMECLRPLDSLLEKHSCLVTLEPAVHAAWIGRTHLVSNAFLAMEPRHPLMAQAIELLRTRDLHISVATEVLTSTGPVLLGEAVQALQTARESAERVVILPDEAFSPLASNSAALEQLRNGDCAAEIRGVCLARGAWGIHHWSNTWARGLAGDLVNDDPREIHGYVFHRGVDSPGFDMKNAGRDVAQLAVLCDANVSAAGFNTDGFIKSAIRPRQERVPMPHAGPTEGLYVKRSFHFGGRLPDAPSE